MNNTSMENLTHDRIQAELLKIFEDIEQSRQQRKLMQAEEEKAKAEAIKTKKESKYYVLGLILSSAVLGAVIALSSAILTKVFLNN